MVSSSTNHKTCWVGQSGLELCDFDNYLKVKDEISDVIFFLQATAFFLHEKFSVRAPLQIRTDFIIIFDFENGVGLLGRQ